MNCIRMFVAMVVFAIPQLAIGSDLPTELAAIRERALADTRGMEILESLTTEVGPRVAGAPSDAAGVAWAIAKFKALGFDRVYTEPVSYPVWERGTSSCEVIKPFPQGLAVTALGGSMGTGKAPIEAEVLMVPSYEAMLKWAPGSAKGKIVFVNQSTQRTRDGSGYGKSVIARVASASAAAKLGARAVLIRSIGTDGNSRTPHTGMMRYDNTPTRIPAGALSLLDADQLERLIQRGKPVVLRLQMQATTLSKPYTGANVIGEITGASKPDEIVAIGGHLDSWDLATGALDDGAGVAITMAAAALIGDEKSPPKRTIRVVLFANEEQGVFGGKAYAQARQAKNEVNKQVVGAESDFGAGRIYEITTKFPEATLPKLQPLFAALEPLGIKPGANTASGNADFSAMTTLGAAAVDLKQDGTHYFDIHHTANDTLDKVDAKDLAQNIAAWTVMAKFFAEY